MHADSCPSLCGDGVALDRSALSSDVKSRSAHGFGSVPTNAARIVRRSRARVRFAIGWHSDHQFLLAIFLPLVSSGILPLALVVARDCN